MARDKGGKAQDRSHAAKAREQTKAENKTDKQIDKVNKEGGTPDEKLRKLLDNG
jgi:hypothetical protein